MMVIRSLISCSSFDSTRRFDRIGAEVPYTMSSAASLLSFVMCTRSSRIWCPIKSVTYN